MPYKLSWKETILEEYRDTLSWYLPTAAPIIEENHLKNVLNGNILESGALIDSNDPYIKNCWCIYKDKTTGEELFDENSKAVPDITQSVKGFYAYDIVWSDV